MSKLGLSLLMTLLIVALMALLGALAYTLWLWLGEMLFVVVFGLTMFGFIWGLTYRLMYTEDFL